MLRIGPLAADPGNRPLSKPRQPGIVLGGRFPERIKGRDRGRANLAQCPGGALAHAHFRRGRYGGCQARHRHGGVSLQPPEQGRGPVGHIGVQVGCSFEMMLQSRWVRGMLRGCGAAGQ